MIGREKVIKGLQKCSMNDRDLRMFCNGLLIGMLIEFLIIAAIEMVI